MTRERQSHPDPEPAMTPAPPLVSLRVLRLREVEHKVGLRKTQIYGLVADGHFPKPLKLTERAIGWLEHEVDAFISARAAARSPNENGGQCGGQSRIER